MRKATLVMFIVLTLFTPCLAQIEPEGLFGIENTLWERESEGGYIGFSRDYAYDIFEQPDLHDRQCAMFLSSSYTDLIFFSMFEITFFQSNSLFQINGLVSPLLGIGFFIYSYQNQTMTDTLKKISDSWNPLNYDCYIIP